jgi:DNA repair exonuclease SbcCD ATPase subunit
MSAVPEPIGGGPQSFDNPEISQAAQLARQRLQEEIERVRNGVEEMLDASEAQADGQAAESPEPETAFESYEEPQTPLPVPPAPDFGGNAEDLRAELAGLRIETRDYVKKKVRKTEKRLDDSVREIGARADKIEQRIDRVETDRQKAEVRIHNNTEKMLDGLLQDVRSIADRLEQIPSPPRAQGAPPAQPKPAAKASAPQAPVGPIGQRPPGR